MKIRTDIVFDPDEITMIMAVLEYIADASDQEYLPSSLSLDLDNAFDSLATILQWSEDGRKALRAKGWD